VKWRFSAPAGGVEESKLCLFSVIMPAKCVSSVCPRFHYRRVAFYFLPLAAILKTGYIFKEFIFASTVLFVDHLDLGQGSTLFLILLRLDHSNSVFRFLLLKTFR
jgi:hypothetical protein